MYINFCYSLPRFGNRHPTRGVASREYIRLHPSVMIQVADRRGSVINPLFWGRRVDEFIAYVFDLFDDVGRGPDLRLGKINNHCRCCCCI